MQYQLFLDTTFSWTKLVIRNGITSWALHQHAAPQCSAHGSLRCSEKVLPHFDFHPFFWNNIFSKKMILNCIGSKRIVLESSPSSDRYSAQSHRWISVFHCRPEIEINRMKTNDKRLCFFGLGSLGMLHSFIFLGYFVILSFFEIVFRKKRKTTLLQLIGLCLSLNGSLRKASSFSLNNKIRICHGWGSKRQILVSRFPLVLVCWWTF